VAGSILYPFKPGKNFYFGYSWVSELARRINFHLTIFTTLPGEITVETKGEVYQKLMAAQGRYWQQYHLIRGRIRSKKKKKVVIESVNGNNPKGYIQMLSEHINQKNYSVIVIQPGMFTGEELDFWMTNEEKPILILPYPNLKNHNDGGGKLNVTEKFYETFRHSELHNIDHHIFDALARDKNLFNYLRHFFTKNR